MCFPHGENLTDEGSAVSPCPFDVLLYSASSWTNLNPTLPVQVPVEAEGILSPARATIRFKSDAMLCMKQFNHSI
jgi:hypothetical protein